MFDCVSISILLHQMSGRLARPRRDPDELVDILARRRFREAEQRVAFEFGIGAAELEAADDLLARQPVPQLVASANSPDDEFVEARAGEPQGGSGAAKLLC